MNYDVHVILIFTLYEMIRFKEPNVDQLCLTLNNYTDCLHLLYMMINFRTLFLHKLVWLEKQLYRNKKTCFHVRTDMRNLVKKAMLLNLYYLQIPWLFNVSHDLYEPSYEYSKKLKNNCLLQTEHVCMGYIKKQV